MHSKNFSGQDLRGKSFKGQNLIRADFRGADIRGTDFENAILIGADFTQATAGRKWNATLILTIILMVLAVLAGFLSGLSVNITARYIFKAITHKAVIIRSTTIWFYIIFLITMIIAIQVGKFYDAIGAVFFIWILVLFGGGLIALALSAIFGAAGFKTNTLPSAIAWVINSLYYLVGVAGMLIIPGIFFLFAWGVAVFVALDGVMSGALIGILCFISAIGTVIFFGDGRSLYTICGPAIIILSFYIAWRAFKGDKQFYELKMMGLCTGILGGTDFEGADLSYAKFIETTLKHTSFEKAILKHACFRDAKGLEYTYFHETILENRDIWEVLTSGYGKNQSFVGQNLQGAYLVKSNLMNADLSHANLSNANLSGASLINTNLSHANLTNADLTNSKLINTNLREANLTDAILKDIELKDADMTGTIGISNEFKSIYSAKAKPETEKIESVPSPPKAIIVDIPENKQKSPFPPEETIVDIPENKQKPPLKSEQEKEDVIAPSQANSKLVEFDFKKDIDWLAFRIALENIGNQNISNNEDSEISITHIETKPNGKVLITVNILSDMMGKRKFKKAVIREYKRQFRQLKSRYKMLSKGKEKS